MGATSLRRIVATRSGIVSLLGYTSLCVFLALPGGARISDRAVWNSPNNNAQFTDWANALSSLGARTSGAQLKEHLWTFTAAYLRARNQALVHIRWIPEQLGFGQSWRMFSNPQTDPSRLWVELDDGHGFDPIYVQGSPEYTWSQQLLEHHRLRKLLGRIGRGGRDKAYRALGTWLAKRAAREFPHARRLRLRVYTWHTESVERGARPFPAHPVFARPKGKFARVTQFRLSKYR